MPSGLVVWLLVWATDSGVVLLANGGILLDLDLVVGKLQLRRALVGVCRRPGPDLGESHHWPIIRHPNRSPRRVTRPLIQTAFTPFNFLLTLLPTSSCHCNKKTPSMKAILAARSVKNCHDHPCRENGQGSALVTSVVGHRTPAGDAEVAD